MAKQRCAASKSIERALNEALHPVPRPENATLYRRCEAEAEALA